MPCPHQQSSTDDDHGIERREFMKAALAIGGTSALAAAEARAHGDGHEEPLPGTDDPASLPDRQYAWNDFVPRNEVTGEAKTPNHHLQFMLSYERFGTPTKSDREQVETALRSLERAFEWSNDGLLFTLGYSPAYFERFDEDLPPETGLRPPRDVVRESDSKRDGAILIEQSDVHMHLASDSALALLQAEEALFGGRDTVNDVEIEADFRGVFERVDRRTGFINNPHEQWDEEIRGPNPVGEDADVWFGFKSLFEDSQPSEDHVAIEDGHPFADGTTEQVSVLVDNRIRSWYRKFDHEERVQRMYSPEHTSEDTGQHGRDLGATSGTEDRREDGKTMIEIADETEDHAREDGVVGHAQKLARAREEDGTPPLLRRDFPSTDGNRVHTQFVSNQRTIDDFIRVRKNMAFLDPDGDDDDRGYDIRIPDFDIDSHPDDHVDLALPKRIANGVSQQDHGIQGHFKVQRRGTYLVPPRDLRALPPARP